jgi:arginase
MRKCLAPFFVGREEQGLERGAGVFDVVLSRDIVDGEPGSKNAVNCINAAIRDFVAGTVKGGNMPVVLSGDCLGAIGCLAGMEECGVYPRLLWFDAHGDFHTFETTISGHLGGMPLAMITGRGDTSSLAAVNLTPIPDGRVYHIGGRDLEVGEKEALRSSSIRCADQVSGVLEDFPSQSSCWVHFDTDYISPKDAPAMRYPAKGGISASDAKADLRTLARRVRILGLSISAWAPRFDENGRTAETCWDTVSSLMLA